MSVCSLIFEKMKDVFTIGEEERIGYELGLGWIPDYPDMRDYTEKKDKVEPKIKILGQKESIKAMLTKIKVLEPIKIDLKKFSLVRYFPQVENQYSLGSCTANAGVALIEYFERKAFNKHVDASRLFLYKVTRNLLGWTGDTGAFLRTTMGAMVIFGVPPEKFWPYRVEDYDKEPHAFCYSYAREYQVIQYYRLDPPFPLINREDLLKRIKVFLYAGLPSMFGFTVYSSISQSKKDGKIPYPQSGEKREGGHAVVAVGFDDDIKIRNETYREEKSIDKEENVETTGALLIRNSWGSGWGEDGYGWLPYEYILKGLAIDWWSVLKSSWIDTGKFGF